MLQDSHPRSLRGVVRRHPEGGAGSSVLRRRLATVVSGGRGPARQAPRPGCEELAVTDPDAGRSVSGGGCSVREARPREPKTATVERREASVPRHGTQGASQAPGVPRYGAPNGGPQRTRTSLGAPPTPRLG